MSSENKEKPQGVRNLPNTSTNGNRGYKRPRNSRGHFASCKNGSASALAINCECITFSQEQKNISGTYISGNILVDRIKRVFQRMHKNSVRV